MRSLKRTGPKIDLEARSSAGRDLKADLLNGRAEVPAKTDCPEWHCKEKGGHTSYFYNSPHGV